MAGPQMLGGGNTGMASLQQGIASIQQLGQFLEQKRQFEEDQNRLNRMQDANWGSKMLDELVKTTGAQSIKDIARDFPSMLSMIFQKGLHASEGAVLPWVTALANSPYNATEAYNEALSILHSYGSGTEEASSALEKSTAKITSLVQNAGMGTGGTAPSSTAPSKATGAEREVLSVQTRAPSGLLDSLKEDLFPVIKADQARRLPGEQPLFQGGQQVFDKYLKTNPEAKTAIEEFRNTQLPDFIKSVESGAWSPGAQTAIPSASTAISGATPKTSAAVPTAAEKTPAEFWSWMYGQGKVTNQNASPQAMTKLITDNPGSYQTFLAGGAAAPTAPLKTAAVADTGIASSIKDLFSSVMAGETGQVKRKGKFLEKALTPAIEAQMKKTPEGITALIQNARAIVNDPDILRGIAVMQNAPSVYATELTATGQTAESKITIVKGMKELEKLGYDTETARLKMIEAGITDSKAQNELILSSAVVAMLQSGTIVPPDVASQAAPLQTQMQDALAAANKAKSENKSTEMDAALEIYNSSFKQWTEMMLSVQKAIGNQDGEVAQRLAAVLKAELTFNPGTFLFWNAGNVSKGQFSRVAKATEGATKPSLTKTGAQVGSEYGLQ